MLATAQLRLHKVVSNSSVVMEALPIQDRGKSVQDLDLRHDTLPPQSSLGVQWDLGKDEFIFRVTLPEKPYTRRGILSVVNSVYDPFGVVAPVLLRGKLLLRMLTGLSKKDGESPLGWDDPLPEEIMPEWNAWKNNLDELTEITLPRCYHPKNFGREVHSEIHSFSDASESGIGAAIYLKQTNGDNDVSISFLFGQARLAPLRPRPSHVWNFVPPYCVFTSCEKIVGRTEHAYP